MKPGILIDVDQKALFLATMLMLPKALAINE
jgi:hypothetical protein